jgi:thiol-disulfide isomerase/thioredoxin
MSHLDCHVYYDSSRQPEPPEECGDRVDLATDPDAAGRLARLGLSPATDLPVVVLTEADGKIRIVAVRLSAEETSRLAAGQGIHSDGVVVYSSSWCPDCRRAKRVLEEAEAPLAEVDIDQDHAAEVPTLRFDDRVWAFNPAPPLLRRLLNGRAKVQPRPLKETE